MCNCFSFVGFPPAGCRNTGRLVITESYMSYIRSSSGVFQFTVLTWRSWERCCVNSTVRCRCFLDAFCSTVFIIYSKCLQLAKCNCFCSKQFCIFIQINSGGSELQATDHTGQVMSWGAAVCRCCRDARTGSFNISRRRGTPCSLLIKALCSQC